MASPCVCGANPCYLICPSQDPYAGDPFGEHEDHEAYAAYDDMMERFGQELDTIDVDAIHPDEGDVDPNSLASLSWQSRREIRRIEDAERARATEAAFDEAAAKGDILF